MSADVRRWCSRWPLLLVISLALSGLVAFGPAHAQQVRLEVPGGPHYLGSPVDLQLSARGFEEDPAPQVEVSAPTRGQLHFLGVSPSVKSSISIINGRVSRAKDVSFVYRYRYLPSGPGDVEIGPFRVTQGGTERVAAPARLEFRAVPQSDRMQISLELPAGPFYVGERIPVELEFALDRELQERLESYSLQVPLFDLTDRFRFVDDDQAEGDTEVVIETATGALRLRGNARNVDVDGRPSLVVKIARTLIPLESGAESVAPPVLIASEATRWTRDFLGGRRATHVRKLMATGRERNIEVRGVPDEGVPTSFAGAVGSGFSLEVTADRSVVQVGEPITITLTLRGDGNLGNAALPPLDAEGLLPSDHFRVPDDQLTGTLEDATVKRFTAVVRVLDDTVREIPALEYAWFDPATRAFQTTRSRPIALQVRPTQVIGATEVVREAVEPESAAAPAAADPAPVARSSALTGADLAIVHEPARLLRDARAGYGGAWLPAALYAGPLLLLALAELGRRRRTLDPELQARRRSLDSELRALRDAAQQPRGDAIAAIAAALRRMLATAPEAASPELDSLLGELDALSFAPDAAAGALSDAPALRDRALALGERIAEAGR